MISYHNSKKLATLWFVSAHHIALSIISMYKISMSVLCSWISMQVNTNINALASCSYGSDNTTKIWKNIHIFTDFFLSTLQWPHKAISYLWGHLPCQHASHAWALLRPWFYNVAVLLFFNLLVTNATFFRQFRCNFQQRSYLVILESTFSVFQNFDPKPKY
jgi:hypothetical protein